MTRRIKAMPPQTRTCNRRIKSPQPSDAKSPVDNNLRDSGDSSATLSATDAQENGSQSTSATDLLALARAVAKLSEEHRATLLAKLPDDERAAVEALAESVGG